MGSGSRLWRFLKLTMLAVPLAGAVLSASSATAQEDSTPCNPTEAPPMKACPPGIPIMPQGSFQAVPLIDGNTSLRWPIVNGALHTETVTLYGQYGNDEQHGLTPAAQHYIDGMTEGGKIQPLCADGTVPNPNCSDGKQPAIVFLFIGFSNCTIEICGGDQDIWSNHNPQLNGQPCATSCPNPQREHLEIQSWNQPANDPMVERSLLYQAYNPQTHFLSLTSKVYIFDGAQGSQTLDHWDPHGYYTMNSCDVPNDLSDPECEYARVSILLQKRGLSENQVQAVFLKSSTDYPQCDLSGFHCSDPVNQLPDAYLSEQYLANIMRYLKCCKRPQQGQPPQPRYPNLHQVFVTTRIYGGYAQNPQGTNITVGCMSPEPFSYQTVTKRARISGTIYGRG